MCYKAKSSTFIAYDGSYIHFGQQNAKKILAVSSRPEMATETALNGCLCSYALYCIELDKPFIMQWMSQSKVNEVRPTHKWLDQCLQRMGPDLPSFNLKQQGSQ